MRCSICLSGEHTANSCPYRPRWYDTAISLVAVAALVVGWAVQALTKTG